MKNQDNVKQKNWEKRKGGSENEKKDEGERSVKEKLKKECELEIGSEEGIE